MIIILRLIEAYILKDNTMRKYKICYLGFGCGGYIIGYNIIKSIVNSYIKNKQGNTRIFATKKQAQKYLLKIKKLAI